MEDETNTVDLATELTIAWLANPNTRTSADDVPGFLRRMHDAVQSLAAPTTEAAEPAKEYTPATTVRKSLASPDHIISLIDGKPYRTLKRHLATNGLTPADYRERYGLKTDYPMVAPSYAASRSEMAKRIGLGRKAGESVKKADGEAEASAKAPAKRTRKSGVEAKKAAQEHLS